VGEYEEDLHDYPTNGALQLPAPNGSKNSNMSVMKRNQNGEFDHNKWLFETHGTYGVGNAYWPQDEFDEDGDEAVKAGMLDHEKPWKPLSRITPIPSSIISPYRLIN